MLKTCQNCGVEFEGSPQARFHSNACRVAYSRREVAHEVEHSVRVPEEVAHDETPAAEVAQRRPQAPKTVATPEQVAADRRAKMNVPTLIREARSGEIELTRTEEQRIRDHFGYAPSERRTLAERDAVAKRITRSLEPLSQIAFPYQEERPIESWTLRPTAEKLARLHAKSP